MNTRARTRVLVAIATTLGVVLAASGAAASASVDKVVKPFNTWTGYEVGDQPIAVTSADFNGDGAADVAYARHLCCGNTMVVQLNAGGGKMGPGKAMPATPASNDIAAGDVDSDGDSDIVVVAEGAGLDNTVIDIYRNDGKGHFSRTKATGGHGAQRVAVADLNGDGNLDLAVTSYWQQHTVSVLLGWGDGTFRPETLLTVGPYTTGIVASDLDGDGAVDLAVGWFDNLDIVSYVTVLRNGGDGRFKRAVDVEVTARPGTPVVATADFNGDGRQDLAVAGGGTDQHTVLVNRGQLSFSQKTYTGGFSATNISAADVDHDGAPDLVSATVGGSSTGWVSYLHNDGHGSFGVTSVDAGARPWDAEPADFTGDGRLDVAVANNGSGTGDISPQLPDGTFANPPVYLAVVGQIPLDSTSADFDGDGLPDMALTQIDITSGGTDAVAIMHNDGGGRMRFAQRLPSGTDSHPKSVYASDLNDDGAPDLLWTPEQFSGGSYKLAVALNDGKGSFGAVTTYLLVSGGTGQVTTADVDGDGDQDAIVANDRGPGGVRVALNRGDGTFKPDYAVPMGDLQAMAIGVDLNGDKAVDIAAVNPQLDGSGRSLMVAYGRGDGSFEKAKTYQVGNGPRELAAGDFNGDGKIDLVTANQGGDGISNFSIESTSILINAGNEKFTVSKLATEWVFGYFNQFAIAVGDVNGDGAADVVDAHPIGQNYGVYYGNGHGGFGPELRYGGHANVADVNLADYNGDGLLDIGGPETVNDGTLFPTGGVGVLLNRR